MTIEIDKYDDELGDFLSSKLKAAAKEVYEQHSDSDDRDDQIAVALKMHSRAMLHALSAVMQECTEFVSLDSDELLAQARRWVRLHEAGEKE